MGLNENTTRVYFVRHCEVDEAYHDILYGQMDVALSARGRQQSRDVALELAAAPFAAIYTSDAERAVFLAELIADNVPGIEVLHHPEFRERHFGDWQGRTWADIEQSDADNYARFLANKWAPHPPKAESCDDIAARALPLLERLVRRHVGRTIAVVSHAGTARVALATALRMAPERAYSFQLKHGAVSIVDYRNVSESGIDEPYVRLING